MDVDVSMVGALVAVAIAAAEESGRDVADIPLDEIAQRAGISRATLYRRIRSRDAFDAAVRAAGVDPGGQPSVHERATLAAADIIRAVGVGGMTLEAVAVQAGCSMPALHSQLGGREGILSAVFERYHPLPRIERLLAAPPSTFEETVRSIQAVVFDAGVAEPALLRAVVAEALARPRSPAIRHLAGEYLPRAIGLLGGWLAEQVAAGRCRPLPVPVLAQLLIGPVAIHTASRDVVGSVPGLPLPGREETIDHFAAAFCRAVTLPSLEEKPEKTDASDNG